MDQERHLLASQVQSLTEDLNQRTEELLNLRKDNSLRSIQLEVKLAEKTQELMYASENIKNLTDLNNNLTAKAEELTQKLYSEKETGIKLQESMELEMKAQNNLVDIYKKMIEEKVHHCDELSSAVTEV